MKKLAKLFGPNTIKLRFDPIVHYIDMQTKETHDNLEHFEKIIKFI